LGFEIECVIVKAFTQVGEYSFSTGRTVNSRFSTNWKNFLKELGVLNEKIIVGYDGSINCDDYDRAVELKTSPLPPKDAMILLKKLLDIVNKYGFTNRSCGFHVNISSAHAAKMKKFNPLPFLSSRIWDEILEEFNRSGNTYCYPILLKNRTKNFTGVERMNQLLQRSKEKYRCVTLRNFGITVSKRSRIEVRGFGNHDYSKKFDKIAAYIKRIERLFDLCCSTFSEIRTPKV